ncbi:DEAD/DEAH box helicase family protein [Sedimenticola selenatireducens]|uniref:DEAD/DEAH box helicase n=1 Tax=Sedimenticola selenatireducens TaxID=191960 RepID=UPI002AAAC2C3|nr:DEAD/DEAH box helicase family protein [Sedimenticola selenatireducens]
MSINNKPTVLSVLGNMRYEGITRIADELILTILNEVDNTVNISKLQTTILNIYGEGHLLLDANKRKVIFEYLLEEEAQDLCNVLNCPNNDRDVWAKLIGLNFNDDRKLKLLKYFNIPNYEELLKEPDVVSYPDIMQIIPNYGLFLHQERAAAQIKNLLVSPRSRVLLHMPTGSGKTRTAMSISCDYIRNHIEKRDGRVVFWFADTEELCRQAADEFERAWTNLGVGETNLYRLYGNSNVSLANITSGFVIAGLQKINSMISHEQNEFYAIGKRTSLLIFDEAHKALAPTYGHIINVFQTTGTASLLGLSATPGRSTFDAADNAKFAEFFDYKKVVLEVEGYVNPIDYLQEEGYLAKTIYHPLPYDASEIRLTRNEIKALTDGEDVPKSLLIRLGLDAKRNILILNLIIELCQEKRQIILFSCSVSNAETLYTLLKYKNINAGIVTSKTDNKVRQDTVSKYKSGDIQVIVNYGVLTTGFDAPKTNTAVIARPTTSLTLFSQMVGRATRGLKAGGNATCDIFVINDALPGFRNMADAFCHWDDAWIEEE